METVLAHPIIRHAYCGFLASLPVMAIAVNFSCYTFWVEKESDMLFCAIVLVSLLHYVNFTILTSWVKSVLATLAGVALLLLVLLGICKHPYSIDGADFNSSVTTVMPENYTAPMTRVPLFEGTGSIYVYIRTF